MHDFILSGRECWKHILEDNKLPLGTMCFKYKLLEILNKKFNIYTDRQYFPRFGLSDFTSLVSLS